MKQPNTQTLSGARLYFYAMIVVSAFFIAISPHPPLLQDYPTWVYEGVAFSHTLSGHPDSNFVLKRFAVPNSLSDISLGVLSTCFGWVMAAKLWIIFYLLLSAFSYQRFMKASADLTTQAYWIVPGVGITNLCFWYGFINFQLGVALMVLFCSCLLRQTPRATTLGALLGILFFAHAIPFAIAAFALLLLIVETKRWGLSWAYLPSVLLSGWYAYGRFLLTGDRESSVLGEKRIPYLSLQFIAYKVNSYFKSVGYANVQIHSYALHATPTKQVISVLMLAVTLLTGASLLFVLAKSGKTGLRKHHPQRFLWRTVAAALLLAVICPSEALGVSDPGSRCLVCGLVLAVLCSVSSPRFTKVACVGSCLLGLIGCWNLAQLSLRLHQPGMNHPPTTLIDRFAHVAPSSRAYYYDFLAHQRMTLPTFDTSIFLNRRPQSHGDPPQN